MKTETRWSFLALATMLLAPGCAAPKAPSPASGEPSPYNVRAHLQGSDIVAEQGLDEDHQSVSVRIWGSIREPSFFEHGFRRLRDIATEQYVIISRNEGTGPLYRLQIIDFLPSGISTWSYWSEGKPEVRSNTVLLGRMKGGRYEGAGTEYVYSAFTFTENGLVATSE
ncbi:MAG: hypothetical protein AAB393_15690 [Bacteroidota bacterium]